MRFFKYLKEYKLSFFPFFGLFKFVNQNNWSDYAVMGHARSGQKNFCHPATPVMENIIDLHHDIMCFVIFISLFVFGMLVCCLYLYSDLFGRNVGKNNGELSRVTHDNLIEIVWTIIPAAILFAIGVSSFNLLYSMSAPFKGGGDTKFVVKIVGNQ